MVRITIFALVFVTTAMSGLRNVTADVVRDGSIGPSTAVQPAGPNFVIDETMGQISGTNLFHSFDQFSLTSSESATFTAVSPIDNVLSRVTGNAPSIIDGSLISTIPNANFYFINPRGVIFGENATIDVDGSLHISTADSVLFSTGERFEIQLGGKIPILASAVPQAFGFLGSSAPIEINGATIEVNTGERLSLIGGDILLDGAALTAPSGNILLVSTSSTGDVPIGSSPDTSGFEQLGMISLSNDTELDVSGDPVGSVLIRAQQLTAIDSSINAVNEGNTNATSSGIDIDVRDTLQLSGESEFSTTTEANGDGGDIKISATTILLQEEGELVSDTEGAGAAGAVRLNADSVILSGDAEVASDVETGASGRGGNVVITARIIEIRDEAEISTDTDPGSSGDGGGVELRASEAIRLNIRTEPGEEAGVFSNSEGSGDAGSILIDTPILTMDGGVITAKTESVGRGGDVVVQSDNILIENGATISAESSGTGDAGNIAIDGSGQFIIQNGGAVNALSEISNGGNIDIGSSESFDFVLLRRGQVSANVNDGIGGNITISGDAVVVDNSNIVAQAGAGQGGAIVINTKVFLENNSLISASAGPAGISGTVDINAPEIDLSSGLESLPTNYLDATALLRAACASRRADEVGNLVVRHPLGVPSSPEGLSLLDVDSTPPALRLSQSLEKILAQSNKARRAIQDNRFEEGGKIIAKSLTQLHEHSDHISKSYILIHIAATLSDLAAEDPTSRRESLLKAYAALDSAREIAAHASDHRALSFVLGNLGLLYATEGRNAEALYLVRRALTEAEESDSPEALYRWHWHEGRLLWAAGQADAAIHAYRRAISVLEATRQEARALVTDTELFFTQGVAPVYLDLVDALLAASQMLNDSSESSANTNLLFEARDVIERFHVAELSNYFHDECVAQLEAKVLAPEAVSPNTAVVYPILFPERIELLVSLPDGIHRYTVPISSVQLESTTRILRQRLQDPTARGYMGPAQRLFEWLVAPYADELERQDIDTMVFVPHGVLRTVPMAALYDGNNFLIERYAIAVTPGLGLVDPQPLDRTHMNVLLAGLSIPVQGFSALPNVRQELERIQEIFGGQILLDEEFRLDRLQKVLVEQQPTIVHLASHAQFTGDPQSSFILTFESQLTVDRIESYIGASKFRELPLELLVLSACETAAGDDRSALGLSGIAIRAGARSALGSLWSISDESTAELISVFYEQLQDPRNSKAAALRTAQVELLNDSRFAHPFFWSPFLLIGNWL